MPLFPLNVVLFPGMRLPLHIFEERYKLMIGTCMVTDQTFGVALIRSGTEVGGPAEVYAVGTTARILTVDRLPEGRMNLVAVGVDRFRLLERLDDQPYARGRVALLPDDTQPSAAALAGQVSRKLTRYLVARGAPADRVRSLELPSEPLALSYLVAALLKAPVEQRQRLLEAPSVAARLRQELALLEWETGGPPQLNARSFSLN